LKKKNGNLGKNRKEIEKEHKEGKEGIPRETKVMTSFKKRRRPNLASSRSLQREIHLGKEGPALRPRGNPQDPKRARESIKGGIDRTGGKRGEFQKVAYRRKDVKHSEERKNPEEKSRRGFGDQSGECLQRGFRQKSRESKFSVNQE